MVRMMQKVIDRGTGTPRDVRPARRRQDRHQPELARRLVRRLHARTSPPGVWVGNDDDKPMDRVGRRRAAGPDLEAVA